MHGWLSEVMCSVNIMCAYTDDKALKPARQCSPWADRRCRGISIIEVAMASALLIVAMVPILKNLTRAHQLSADMEQKTFSLVLAQGKLDEIKARSVYHYSDSFAQTSLSLGNSYLCNVTDDGADPLRTVTVSVGYDDNGDNILSAGEVEVTLATYIARRW